jgi:glycine dehydrogenase subunit 1
MDFISNKEPQQRQMLEAIGVKSIDDLFVAIPEKLRVPRPTHDDGLSEMEGMRLMESIADKNTFIKRDNYIGAGAYEHHVPAIIGSLTSKGEFLTAYTPYQPEASQGMLQIIFEFQTAVATLTGMDVSNASLYDGASACAEAVLMSLRLQKERNRIVIAETLNPLYRDVVEQYTSSLGVELVILPATAEGLLDIQALDSLVNDKTAAILLQYPNFLGLVDRVQEASTIAKAAGALTIVCANPMAYALYRTAGEMGADIAVGDMQPLGLPLNYGGPYVGYIACRKDLVRQMPGRIVGETVDTHGRKGYVLTLQAREQHIRREKATSNICTNQSLAALATLIGTLWYGKKGLPKLALENYRRAAYLRENLLKIPGMLGLGHGPYFNEFAVKFPQPAKEVLEHFRKHNIEPGLDITRFDPRFADYILVAVTEMKTKEQLDRYLTAAKELASRSHK